MEGERMIDHNRMSKIVKCEMEGMADEMKIQFHLKKKTSGDYIGKMIIFEK